MFTIVFKAKSTFEGRQGNQTNPSENWSRGLKQLYFLTFKYTWTAAVSTVKANCGNICLADVDDDWWQRWWQVREEGRWILVKSSNHLNYSDITIPLDTILLVIPLHKSDHHVPQYHWWYHQPGLRVIQVRGDSVTIIESCRSQVCETKTEAVIFEKAKFPRQPPRGTGGCQKYEADSTQLHMSSQPKDRFLHLIQLEVIVMEIL